MANPTRCTVPGCLAAVRVKSRGLCNKHYSRWVKTGSLEARPYRGSRGKGITLTERIWAKIEKVDGHWLWRGSVDKTTGYGSMSIDGSLRKAHRVVYELLVEPIPEGLHIDHLCRVRDCVNPSHLEPVTCMENVHRSPITHAGKTHCPRGHEYDRVWKGRRHCSVCQAEYMRHYRNRGVA